MTAKPAAVAAMPAASDSPDLSSAESRHSSTELPLSPKKKKAAAAAAAAKAAAEAKAAEAAASQSPKAEKKKDRRERKREKELLKEKERGEKEKERAREKEREKELLREREREREREKEREREREREKERERRLHPSPLLRRFSNLIGRGKSKAAKYKHDFSEEDQVRPTWCDQCEDFIWGLNQFVKCRACNFACHRTCLYDVTDPCPCAANNTRAQPPLPDRAVSPNGHYVSAGTLGLLAYLEASEVNKRIVEYNATTKGQKMEIVDAANPKLFRGYIRVTMNLTQPIKVAGAAGQFPPSLYALSEDGGGVDENEKAGVSAGGSHGRGSGGRGSGGRGGRRGSGSSGGSGGKLRRRASTKPSYDGTARVSAFVLPKNVSKGLFTLSSTTADEVIAALLNKFKIITNPRKFVLYEVNTKENSSRRIRRNEEPLVLQLLWGGNNTDIEFSLKENTSNRDLDWTDFSEAELDRFLEVLKDEEEQCVQQLIKQREAKQRQLEKAIEALEMLSPGS
eukprot:m.130133 g.130133  ORF g.130133 m.130133 type:complete len:512 (+) comp16428_c2_seq3:665-2200(+)